MGRSPSAENRFNQEALIWDRCLSLTSGLPWEDGIQESQFSHARTAAWADTTGGFLLTAHANSKNNNEPSPVLYELARLGTADAATDLSPYTKYFVLKTGLYAVLHARIESPSDMTPEAVDDTQQNFSFAVDNGFTTPNDEDKAQLAKILESGYMGGVEPYIGTN